MYKTMRGSRSKAQQYGGERTLLYKEAVLKRVSRYAYDVSLYSKSTLSSI